MKLTNKQKEKFEKWLDLHWKSGDGCPVCKHNYWTINDSVFELREFNEGKLILKGSVIPVVVLTCERCGYVFYFNAINAGLVAPSKKNDKK